MREKLINDLLEYPGLSEKEDLVRDLIDDCIHELKDLLNYEEADELPEALSGVVKELILMKFHRMGAEGLTSVSRSGVSENYSDELPVKLRRRIYRYRKMRR
ncbi:phage head-tail connector protein [Frisingicoccus sp.]|uniref:phage head-tail connector protein n=1 Tax=Frisingicoccus sp. TaxID=1918627 RepID=UPI003AB8AA0D